MELTLAYGVIAVTCTLRCMQSIPSLKTRFAALNFQGTAAIWLQTVEHQGRIGDWNQLCDLVFERFDKDQYQIQLKQSDVDSPGRSLGTAAIETGTRRRRHVQCLRFGSGGRRHHRTLLDRFLASRWHNLSLRTKSLLCDRPSPV